eukprot:scaffold272388_cov41-Tisochrysis_lutea.AAC.1
MYSQPRPHRDTSFPPVAASHLSGIERDAQCFRVVANTLVGRVEGRPAAVADDRLRDPREVSELLLGMPDHSKGGRELMSLCRAGTATETSNENVAAALRVRSATVRRAGWCRGWIPQWMLAALQYQNHPRARVSVVAVGDCTGSGSLGQMALPNCMLGMPLA